MAWYDRILQVDEFNVPYGGLRFYANPIGFDSLAKTEPPRFEQSKQFLKSAYDLGIDIREGETEYDDKYEIAEEFSTKVIPEDDFTRWLIFTDLKGWETIEYEWKQAIEEAAEFDADDRGVIPYRILQGFAENLILAGMEGSLYKSKKMGVVE